MKEITLTQEELNELLTAMQEHRDIAKTIEINEFAWSFSFGDFVIKQMSPYDLFNVVFQDNEPVLFNIIDKDGKLVFEDDEFIFTFIFCKSDVVRVGTTNGEKIIIGITNGEKIILDDIISK